MNLRPRGRTFEKEKQNDYSQRCRCRIVRAGLTLGLVNASRYVSAARAEGTVMGSSIFDWNSFKATPTKLGAERKVLQTPTATLDELECHITTLNPGETPHPPLKHPAEEVLVIHGEYQITYSHC